MSVDAKTVRHIAKLARIAVSDAEVEALAPDLRRGGREVNVAHRDVEKSS